MAQFLAQLLEDKRVIVCVGAGGVGKTTISAALGVAAALQGRRALVLTVDPARRLANALGLQTFNEDIQTLTVADFAAQGLEAKAPLDVAMLDIKSTFDRTVQRLSPDEESAQAILENRFYQQGSTVLAGSQEYMAMARLYEVVTETAYDLIVLDTPPSAHALDFLDAPQRMINLFGSTTFRRVLGSLQRSAQQNGGEPGGIFGKRSLVMRGLSRFTSAESFGNLLHFFALLSTTFDGFIRTAEDVMTLLRSERTAFMLVAACDDASTQGALFLHERLLAEKMTIGGWVLNRVQGYSDAPLRQADATASALRAAAQRCGLEASAADAVLQVGQALARMAEQDHAHLRALRAELDAQVTAANMAAGPAEATRGHDAAEPADANHGVGAAATVIPVPRSRQEPTHLRELAALAHILTDAVPVAPSSPPPAKPAPPSA